VIIIEGADGVGKTTAAEYLAKKMGELLQRSSEACYRHMDRPSPRFDHFMEYAQQVGPVVQDRFHLGNVVYQRMLAKGQGGLDAKRFCMVQRYLRWQGALVIVLVADHDWLADRFHLKEELYKKETVLAANEGFRLLTKTTNRGEPYCDLFHDVTRGWPNEADLDGWIANWRLRWIF